MEMSQLLALALVIVFAVSRFRRRAGRYGCPAPILARIKVGDPGVARRMLVDRANAFSDRGLSTFPVDFNAGRAYESHSITTVPLGPLWRALRCNLTAEILHPVHLGRLAGHQHEAVSALVVDLLSSSSSHSHNGGEVAVRDCLHRAMFPLIVRLCFGDGVDAHDVRAMQNALMEFFAELVPTRAMQVSRLARLRNRKRWLRFAGTFSRLIDLFAPLIEARRRRAPPPSESSSSSNRGNIIRSYVDSLVALQVPDDDNDKDTGGGGKRALRDDEIAALVWEFLGAGTWTVVATIEWTLAHLIVQPEVQTKLYHEIAGGDRSVLTEEGLRRFPYLRAVALESLRLHPSVPFIIRDAAAGGIEGGTASLAASSSLMVNFMVSARDVGRNPEAWTHPNEFLPERFLPGGEGHHVSPMPGSKEIKMMPFGAGRRSCPGAGLAMLHVKMFVAALVREFEWSPPPDDNGVDLREANGFFKVMKMPLRARITPRNNK